MQPRTLTMSPRSKSRGNARIGRLPGAGLHLPALVAEDQVQIGLVGLGGAQLPGQNQKKAIEQLSFFERSQIRIKMSFILGEDYRKEG